MKQSIFLLLLFFLFVGCASKESRHQQLLSEAQHKDSKEALILYTQLANEDDTEAQKKLAHYYQYKNFKKSQFWFEKLVEKEERQSMQTYAFANLHMVPPIQVQNVQKAIKIYERLVDLNDTSSMMMLGNIYEYGYFRDVVPINKEKALYYYEKAFKEGYLVAHKKLLEIYSCQKCQGNRYDESKANALLQQLKILSKKEENTEE